MITKKEYDEARKIVVDYEMQEYENGIWERGIFRSPVNRVILEGKRNKETNEYFFILRDTYNEKSGKKNTTKVVDADIIKTWEPYVPKPNYKFKFFELWEM